MGLPLIKEGFVSNGVYLRLRGSFFARFGYLVC